MGTLKVPNCSRRLWVPPADSPPCLSFVYRPKGQRLPSSAGCPTPANSDDDDDDDDSRAILIHQAAQAPHASRARQMQRVPARCSACLPDAAQGTFFTSSLQMRKLGLKGEELIPSDSTITQQAGVTPRAAWLAGLAGAYPSFCWALQADGSSAGPSSITSRPWGFFSGKGGNCANLGCSLGKPHP